MLYHLLYSLHTTSGVFNVFRYITFRAAMASLLALILSFVLGPPLIRFLSSNRMAQPIRVDGPRSHHDKKGTPTMGGALIILALCLATLALADLTNPYVQTALFVTLGFAGIGFVDDVLKLSRQTSTGLSGPTKLFLQFLFALAAILFLFTLPNFTTALSFPFLKNLRPDLGWAYVPFATLVVVGASNAVNLTDGLDGLAIGPVTTAAGKIGRASCRERV